MNSYKNVMTMELCRTGRFGADILFEENEPCPVCSSKSWDYLLRDKDGILVGCDECLSKIYS